MAGFFGRILGRGTKGSKSTAKERLQFILVHDRINLPPERMTEMKEEILAVISKYVSIDRDNVDIALQKRDRNENMLIAEIPFARQNQDAESADTLMDMLKEDSAEAAEVLSQGVEGSIEIDIDDAMENASGDSAENAEEEN